MKQSMKSIVSVPFPGLVKFQGILIELENEHEIYVSVPFPGLVKFQVGGVLGLSMPVILFQSRFRD